MYVIFIKGIYMYSEVKRMKRLYDKFRYTSIEYTLAQYN